MKKIKKPRHCLILTLVAIGLLAPSARAQYVYTTIDDPLALAVGGYTYAEGVYGNTVVGYFDDFSKHGFYHVLGTTNYVTLDDPVGYANGNSETGCYGISGTNIAGWYYNNVNDSGFYGFVFNIVTSNYTTIENPAGIIDSSSDTQVFGIDGTNVVGFIETNGLPYDQYVQGFYGGVGGPYTEFYYPTPEEVRNEGSYNLTNYATYAYGISGTNIAGFWVDDNLVEHGFVYNTVSGNYTMVLSPSGGSAPLYGINGNTVVGYFVDTNNNYNYSGFTYNLVTSNYTIFRDPSAGYSTYAQGIYGTTVVGYYEDSSGNYHGFAAQIPVPVLNIIAVGTNAVLTATNGVPGASCRVLDTTNLALPLSQWSVLSTNVFNSNGDFSLTNGIIPGSATFYELSETP